MKYHMLPTLRSPRSDIYITMITGYYYIFFKLNIQLDILSTYLDILSLQLDIVRLQLDILSSQLNILTLQLKIVKNSIGLRYIDFTTQ